MNVFKNTDLHILFSFMLLMRFLLSYTMSVGSLLWIFVTYCSSTLRLHCPLLILATTLHLLQRIEVMFWFVSTLVTRQKLTAQCYRR